ncbi:RNA polymerase subunit sigma [Variovorax paradoxus]|jgi:RNA polymerase sigma-70 factor (ECF subfamily)|uniref:sigma-70 family RNA polymerase sigma factor n=1 Tax=Variovorax TaxID=34072 RepID=UPI0006E5B5B3|nr:sigma-70 family RNA polymerase sigma factor [Variovorax sp.]KPU93724.1 RNA polymerase subunit sigma [Variovorax paradoxus]KPV10792.1 RNA polymerase subunit sigma [Variovorax paradoxus]KPV10862.1 RNA polymerase subunit sigma [Variovorax paradoxus]KPV11132.1 RNA polymerase subunit sigma [Variovorax paradoxus]KPV24172.1 RNA polymerase subunit sigma [Variovorax paradoxus]
MPAAEFVPPHEVQTLYSNHHGWLQGWLRRKLGCPHNAADLAQDTFVRVLGKKEPVAAAEPRAYLATIANGLVVDFHRRRALERAYLETLAALPEPQSPSLEERAIVLEALSAIDAMLDGMTPAIRQAFILSQLEGLTYAQIAQRLQVTVRTVNNYMLKALEHCYLLAP